MDISEHIRPYGCLMLFGGLATPPTLRVLGATNVGHRFPLALTSRVVTKALELVVLHSARSSCSVVNHDVAPGMNWTKKLPNRQSGIQRCGTLESTVIMHSCKTNTPFCWRCLLCSDKRCRRKSGNHTQPLPSGPFAAGIQPNTVHP